MSKYLPVLVCALLFLFPADVRGEEPARISYMPQLFGAVKAKFELSTYDSEHRFNVRNSRIGVRGAVSRNMRYVIQIDFNNEGKVSILDSYATYKWKSIAFSLGQQQYSFSTDLDRGPSGSFFSNRSMLAKFITSYYGSNIVNGKEVWFVQSIGSRDIGFLAEWEPEKLPLKISSGIFNGGGSNNPEWSTNVNVVARLELGYRKGFGAAASSYSGGTPVKWRVIELDGGGLDTERHRQKLQMWSGEFHYRGDKLIAEAEYAQRRINDSGVDISHAALIQSTYRFDVPKFKEVQYIAPQLRFDMGWDLDFLNEATRRPDSFTAQRATVALNFGFAGRLVSSELRFSYEKYFINKKPSDFTGNKLLQDKFTVEIVASF